jgi:hypothetical protein
VSVCECVREGAVNKSERVREIMAEKLREAKNIYMRRQLG